MRRRLLLTALCFSPLLAWADFSGSWAATFEFKVDGDNISFVENLNYQEMPLAITYTRVLTSDDEINFVRDVAGIAMEQLTAKRKL